MSIELELLYWLHSVPEVRAATGVLDYTIVVALRQ